MTAEEDFLAKLMATFQVEAEEHLKAISDGLLALEKDQGTELNDVTLETIFREAHSLKGAARAVSLHNIQDICQAFENVLGAWKKGSIKSSSAFFDTLYHALEFIRNALLKPPSAYECTAEIQKLNACITKSAEEVKEPPQKASPQVLPTPPKTIRVSLSKLDHLFHEAEEMLMAKLSAEKQTQELQSLLEDLQRYERELIRHTAEPRAQIPIEFKERLIRLTKISQQNTHDVQIMVDALLDDMKKGLMQPLSILFDAMPLMVREISKELGKEVNIEFQGGEIEIGRVVSEEIKDPLIHLIRNAIDHGIETPEERKKSGKPLIGTIRIKAEHSSQGGFELSISDDGRGIDIQKIKAAAVQQQVLTQTEADTLQDEAAIKLAFHSGVSTSPRVTELSGRGLGLGIVAEKVDKLEGKIAVESVAGKGAVVRLLLPLSLATFRGVHFCVSNHHFILPTHNVERILKLENGEIKKADHRQTLEVEGATYPFIPLARVLGIESENGANRFALLLHASGKTIAFGIDKLIQEREILVKSLPSPCIKIKNVLAATILEWGEVVPILNPSDLMRYEESYA